ncbi:MAG TPA: CoA transferase [Thermoanaerobaculia bacterium]|nr:CoA transferase [Thermoanaerobaculia bacterium]
MKPLHGIVVADFSRVLAGPLCTQLLADAGARVIKIESPEGDETRRWGPPFVRGVSAYFLSINRNKESIVVDLKSRDGSHVAKQLVDRADVVVDNFLPAQRAKLLPRNPRAVHCSIAGFDSDSAEGATPGYDLLAQAGSGMMSITGDEPTKVGVAVVDVLTAHYAYGAICAALVARERTGEGSAIEVSLFGAAVASLINVAQSALLTGEEAKSYGNAHASIVPYQLFHGSDRAFAIGAGTDRHFAQLCDRVIGTPELKDDPRFATNAARVANREALIESLEQTFAAEAADVWVERCKAAAIPASLVRGVREALRSAEGQALIETIDHPDVGRYEAVRNPIRIDGQRHQTTTPPPRLGQHTEEILRELSERDDQQHDAAE